MTIGLENIKHATVTVKHDGGAFGAKVELEGYIYFRREGDFIKIGYYFYVHSRFSSEGNHIELNITDVLFTSQTQ